MPNKENQLQRRGMLQNMCYSTVKSFFDDAGVVINGKGKGDFQVNDEEVYLRLFKFLTGVDRLALGESFMDGQWETDDLTEFLAKCQANAGSYKKSFRFFSKVLHTLPLLLLNMQSRSQCKRDISSHYDIGNDLYQLMLDRTMNYTCAYWTKNVVLHPTSGDATKINNTLCETLEEAQMNKMLLIGRKLHLKPGMRVLDIGCGWGNMVKFLAINFDVHAVGITISKEQYEYATNNDLKPEELEFLRVPGLKASGSGSFEFHLQDYRDIEGTFDRMLCVGMFEHIIGVKNHEEYFRVTRRCLKDDGLFLLHTLGIGYTHCHQVEPFLNKYIFPSAMVPYITQVVDATLNKFSIEDFHNFGFDYYRTLSCWIENFERNWPKLEAKYDERFKRMWHFYLSHSAASLKTRKISLWQIVFSKRGVANGYVSYR